MIRHNGMTFVPKGWGSELWIYNSELYCGKLLTFKKGKKCSLHYHKIKHETFYLQSGEIELSYATLDDYVNALHEGVRPYNILNYKTLKQGERFVLEPFLVHQMYAAEDSELFEFSTQHFDSDSYRIEKGD